MIMFWSIKNIVKCLALFDQKPKTQTPSIHNDMQQRKSANPAIW